MNNISNSDKAKVVETYLDIGGTYYTYSEAYELLHKKLLKMVISIEVFG